jgi:hypothetical protein
MRLASYILFAFIFISASIAQDDKAFTTLYSGSGFDVKFIYYSEGTGKKDNGVVVLLINRNNYSIKYSFELIFRTPEKDKSIILTGKLSAGERRTGSDDNLYFLPFKDKSSIAEVGIRKVRVINLK